MNTHDALNLLSLESPGRKTPEAYSRTFRRDAVQQYVYSIRIPLTLSDFYG